MNRLKVLAILWTLGAAGPPSIAADPDGPSPSPNAEAAAPPRAASAVRDAVNRPEPPAPPIDYLKAGANLFNKGRFDLASKYLAAAHAYRDRLSASERVVLEVYQEKLEQYLHELKKAETLPGPHAGGVAVRPAPEAGTDSAVMAASTASLSGAERANGRVLKSEALPLDSSTPVLGPAPSDDKHEASASGSPPRGAASGEGSNPAPVRGTEAWRDTKDTKQKARWLLQLAREQSFKGQYDEAERTVAEVSGMTVRWGYFDDTPTKVSESIAKARAKGSNPDSTPRTNQPRDRRAAKAKLHEARALLAAGRVEEAEQIASDLRTWGVRYGFLDDTPAKLATALDAARRREAVRDTELMVRSYLGTDPDRVRDQAPAGPSPATAPGSPGSR